MEIEKIPVLDSDLLDFAEYDNYWGAVKEKKSPSGITVVIEVGRSLGLSSYFLFVIGAQKANSNPETDTILLDLSKTINFSDSAHGMIELLFNTLDYHLEERVFFINSSSEIKQKLNEEISRSLVFL